MIHNFKTGALYRHKNFGKCRYVGMGGMYNAPIFEYSARGLDGDINIVSYIYDSATIIGLWEEPVDEQIDVANMWVGVWLEQDGLITNCDPFPTEVKVKKFAASGVSGTLIAIIRASEWEAIKRGERKLIKGEGL